MYPDSIPVLGPMNDECAVKLQLRDAYSNTLSQFVLYVFQNIIETGRNAPATR